MLQQTRVAAVIPYWERFLKRFPDAVTLAEAPEAEVLTLWSGLGYYTRARNLQHAAREIAARGKFPDDYDSIRKLKGVGDYTAAAVASIAFGLPYAVIDGNVLRVVKRLQSDPEANVRTEADLLLDRDYPGRLNQALMELGALVCLPTRPMCPQCPVKRYCEAYKQGTQGSIPPPKVRPATLRIHKILLIIRRRDRVLLTESSRVTGFWELPEPDTPGLGAVKVKEEIGVFRHTIQNRLYTFEVREAALGKAFGAVKGFRWCSLNKLHEIPLSTAARKGLVGLDQGNR